MTTYQDFKIVESEAEHELDSLSLIALIDWELEGVSPTPLYNATQLVIYRVRPQRNFQFQGILLLHDAIQ